MIFIEVGRLWAFESLQKFNGLHHYRSSVMLVD